LCDKRASDDCFLSGKEDRKLTSNNEKTQNASEGHKRSAIDQGEFNLESDVEAHDQHMLLQ